VQNAVSDGALLIGSAQGVLFKKYFGTYDDTTVIPLASASKLLAGIRVLQANDAGVVELDTPVSTLLPAPTFHWQTGNASITLRQMFSHTAGYGNDRDNPDMYDQHITLEQSAQDIADDYLSLAPQKYAPAGTQFAYGGISMQIGGEVVQWQSGVDWQLGWQQAIGAPLCAPSIDWQGLVTDKTRPTTNYPIAGGAEAGLEDYARVLAMIAADGVGNGIRILSPAAIQTLIHNQTGDATLGYAPPAADGSTQYGIGAWLEPSGVSIDEPTISDIGLYGFAPWVDFSTHTFGIAMLYQPNTTLSMDPSANSHLAIVDMIAALRTLPGGGASCSVSEVYDRVFRDAMEAVPAAPECR
jgi:CubicO group peptidase (beta-lactamase class C family)